MKVIDILRSEADVNVTVRAKDLKRLVADLIDGRVKGVKLGNSVAFYSRDEMKGIVQEVIREFDRQLPAVVEKPKILDGETLLTNTDLMRMLGVGGRTLARYRQSKQLNYYIIGGKVRYKRSDLDAFLEKKGLDTTADGQVQGTD